MLSRAARRILADGSVFAISSECRHRMSTIAGARRPRCDRRQTPARNRWTTRAERCIGVARPALRPVSCGMSMSVGSSSTAPPPACRPADSGSSVSGSDSDSLCRRRPRRFRRLRPGRSRDRGFSWTSEFREVRERGGRAIAPSRRWPSGGLRRSLLASCKISVPNFVVARPPTASGDGCRVRVDGHRRSRSCRTHASPATHRKRAHAQPAEPRPSGP